MTTPVKLLLSAVALLAGSGYIALAQSVAPKLNCTVQHHAPSPADIAGLNREADKAATLYEQQTKTGGPNADRDHAGWVRWLLEANRLDDANREALAWSAAKPNSAWALAALSQVQLAQGDLATSATTIQSAHRIDACNSWALDGYARLLDLNAMHASARQAWDTAHILDPDDLDLFAHWINVQAPPVQVAAMTKFLADTSVLTPEYRQRDQAWIETRKEVSPDVCRMVTSFASTTIPYRAIQNGPKADVFWGLDVNIDGSNRRLDVDTSAYGPAGCFHSTRPRPPIYGILGDETLISMTISIDFRDNLMKFTYDPKRIAFLHQRPFRLGSHFSRRGTRTAPQRMPDSESMASSASTSSTAGW
jgi:hypothetical protein